MIVTDLQYALEQRLVTKLDLMIDRCSRKKVEQDALLLVEGATGDGKTNTSTAIGYYVKHRMEHIYQDRRNIHLFFRLAALVQFAKMTEKQIIIWDEPSLDALKKDAMSFMNKTLERLLMTCRKKRHFLIFNLTKFHKFSEYIVVDRCLGIVHMYARKETDPGRFVFIKKKNLEILYQTYLSKKKRMYRELTAFRGQFPEVMSKHFDAMQITVEGVPNCSYIMYNKLKDKAIESIGETESGMGKREANTIKKLMTLRVKVAYLIKKCGITHMAAAAALGISPVRIREWAKIDLNAPLSLGNDDSESSSEPIIITSGDPTDDDVPADEEDDELEPEMSAPVPHKPALQLSA